MAEKNTSFAPSNIIFAKIVATPTLTSWSQAYNAGGLFAVLSLNKENEDSLSILGKELLNTFEEEYFTLEVKNLNSIKQAILTTCQKIPEDISPSFVAVSIINNILYVFVFGDGKVIIKRKEKVGQILEGSQEKELISSSGFLENEDIIILETNGFAKIISKDELIESLEHIKPSEIAENLSPKIHAIEQGAAAAIIISYKACEEKEELNLRVEEEEKKTTQESAFLKYLNLIKSKLSYRGLSFSHSKKLLISLVLVLVFVLFASVFFAIKKQDEAKTKALFNEIYPQAQKKYDEGQSLLGLNKNLARDSLLETQKILDNAKTKFSSSSSENKQILELLQKTKQSLIEASEINSVEAKLIDKDKSLLLWTQFKNSNSKYFAVDGKDVYFINDKGVFLEGKEEAKIKNENYWAEPGGLGVYLNNVYVLDKKTDQIIKFTNGQVAGKTNYFASNVLVDLSKATSIAIDGSIWILRQDGTILKFTKGKADNFSLSGLDKTFLNPTRIFTKSDFDKVYLLDNGNSRIVVFNKEGSYEAQYQSKIIKEAKDFEVLEKNKKIYILSQGKIWEIEIK